MEADFQMKFEDQGHQIEENHRTFTGPSPVPRPHPRTLPGACAHLSTACAAHDGEGEERGERGEGAVVR